MTTAALLLLALVVLVIAAIAGTVVTVLRDGYRHIPTRSDLLRDRAA